MQYVLWVLLGILTAAVARRTGGSLGVPLLVVFGVLAFLAARQAAEAGESIGPAIVGWLLALALMTSVGWAAARAAHDPLAPGRRRLIFVSYRSADVILVRAVTEQLIASGVGVWLCEYEVGISDYDDWNRLVHEGIEAAAGSVAFVGQDYAQSEYCRDEMSRMLRHHGPQGVLVVECGDDHGRTVARFPELAGSEHITSQDPETIVHDIVRLAPFKVPEELPVRAQPTGETAGGTALGTPFRLNADGWKVISPGRGEIGHRESEGPRLQLADASYPVFCNVYVGPQERDAIDLQSDDREVYRATMRQAARHYRHLGALGGAEPRGLHLLRHGDQGQFAITYRMPGYWTRKYSILLLDGSGRGAEFMFTFGVRGSFAEFCRVAAHMDRLVTTLEWGDRARQAT